MHMHFTRVPVFFYRARTISDKNARDMQELDSLNRDPVLRPTMKNRSGNF